MSLYRCGHVVVSNDRSSLQKNLVHSCSEVELRSGRKWELQLPSARACPLSCALRSLISIQLVDDKVCESAEVPASFTSEVVKHFGFPVARKEKRRQNTASTLPDCN